MHDAAVERLDVQANLRGASERNELVVHYQPIYRTGSQRVIAVEALVRWQHPVRGLLGPDAFVPHAEASSLIDEVGDHVLSESLRQVRRWETELGDEAPAVTVNLSPPSTTRPQPARTRERPPRAERSETRPSHS